MTIPLPPVSLRCEWREQPLGMDIPQPRLSWQHPANGVASLAQQHDFRVQVASSYAHLEAGITDIWDSGVVASAAQTVTYNGPPLRSATRYYWRVLADDHNDQESSWSLPSWWETGLLYEHDWRANWIHLPLLNPTNEPLERCRYLRRSFYAQSDLVQARLYITARGLYEASLNGQRIGDQLLTPGWTDYDIRLQYQTYDMTDLIVAGENVLGVILGSGWYSGHLSNIGPHYYGSSPQLLAQLTMTYADGTTEWLVSDGAWRAATGPLVTADLLQGEHYDARREEHGWDLPGFVDDHWTPVEVIARTTRPQLVADYAQPIRVTALMSPQHITRLDDSTQLVDFGQNLVGWVRLKIPSKAYDAIQLRHAEMLDAEGYPYYANLRSAKQTDTFIPRMLATDRSYHPDEPTFDEPTFYTPRFTVHGFRYVEVHGYPHDLAVDQMSACVVGSDTPAIGSFACGQPLVNQLYHNIVWGQRGNFLSVPTDCPQRDERMGWLGDAQVFVRTASYNMDVSAFFTKWMHDVCDGQSANGAFPDIAPRIVVLNDGAPAWGDAGVIVPWTMYRMYGDIRLIEQCWEPMMRWIHYLEAANPTGLRQARNGNNYGDWLAVDEMTENHVIATRTPKDLLATAYYARIVQMMVEMADVLGHAAEAQAYRRLHAHIQRAFALAYIDHAGQILGATQTAYVLALAFDLVPEELRGASARHLVADILARDIHLSTGFLGVGYLLPILSDLGYNDIAYRLLLQETYPSWGYSIRQGATTIWERWDGWTEERGFQDPAMNSFNHYSLGSVGEWLYRYVAGIEPLPAQEGMGQWLLKPQPSPALGWAEATWESPYGLVGSRWHIEGDHIEYALTIPPNTRATVILPTSKPAAARTMLTSQLTIPPQAIQLQAEAIQFLLPPGHFVCQVPFAATPSHSSVAHATSTSIVPHTGRED